MYGQYTVSTSVPEAKKAWSSSWISNIAGAEFQVQMMTIINLAMMDTCWQLSRVFYRLKMKRSRSVVSLPSSTW
jgi:hypothetical protein